MKTVKDEETQCKQNELISKYRSALQDIRNDAQRSIDGVVLPRYDHAAAHHLIRVIDNALGGDGV